MPKPSLSIAIFLTSLACLVLEVVLVRIFQVTMGYHFAFLAVSLAMFGISAGGVAVYFLKGQWEARPAPQTLAFVAVLFSVSIAASLLFHVALPFLVRGSIAGLAYLLTTYLILALPFFLFGSFMAFALAHSEDRAAEVYGFSLAGSGLGCLLPAILFRVLDGPSVAFCAALAAGLGAWILALGCEDRRLRRLTVWVTMFLASLVAAGTFCAARNAPLVRLSWEKGSRAREPIFEKWNAFSLIRVFRDSPEIVEPFGWGLSSNFSPRAKPEQLDMVVDVTGRSVMTAFNGDLGELEHLKYDVANLAYYLKKDARVLVVGSGGGRDVLSALAFGERQVDAVEYNREVIGIVNKTFGDFTGHLDRNPRVRFIASEVRRHLLHSRAKYDLIQASLVNTVSTSQAGALVLKECPLHTLEAWKLFLEALKPDGLLSFSQWYVWDGLNHAHRLMALGAAALRRAGVEMPERHLIMVRNRAADWREKPASVIVTLLVSRRPFSPDQIRTVDREAARMGFQVGYQPGKVSEVSLLAAPAPVRWDRKTAAKLEVSLLAELARGRDLEKLAARFPVNVAPPTDDKPFFYYLLRAADFFSTDPEKKRAVPLHGRMTVRLIRLAGLTGILSLLVLMAPLVRLQRREDLLDAGPLAVYFSLIASGFMFVELAQLSRFNIFLGDPAFGIPVTLAALLVSSGAGSLWLGRSHSESAVSCGPSAWAPGLIGLLGGFGFLTPYVVEAFAGASDLLRMALAALLAGGAGFFMGAAFPLGMNAASRRNAEWMPWLWAVNGAFSVCASVMAVLLALHFGLTVLYWAGFGCYLLAGAVLFLMSMRRENPVLVLQ